MLFPESISVHIPSELREEIWASYREHGTVDAVIEKTGVERYIASIVLDQMPLRQVYRRKGSPQTYDSAFLNSCLQEAGEICGEPLTIPAYRKEAPKRGWPSDLTHVQAHGTWEKACKAAGVEANPSEGPRAGAFTIEDCLTDLRAYSSAHEGKEPSYERYCEWARKTGAISGSTIRVKLGSWRKALQQAFTE